MDTSETTSFLAVAVLDSADSVFSPNTLTHLTRVTVPRQEDTNVINHVENIGCISDAPTNT